MHPLPRRPRLGHRAMFFFSVFWISVALMIAQPTASRLHFDLIPLVVLAGALMLIGCVLWFMFNRD
jgi:hypothetical protein